MGQYTKRVKKTEADIAVIGGVRTIVYKPNDTWPEGLSLPETSARTFSDGGDHWIITMPEIDIRTVLRTQ